MFTHTGVNFTNVYYSLELHYYLGTTMLDLIERTRILIANHPEYMRQNTPCNIPGGHGQRLIRHSEKVNPYYKKLCSFDMSPEYANQIMFAQDFRINANKIVVRQTELDAFPAMRPNVSGDPILLTAAEVIDTFNKFGISLDDKNKTQQKFEDIMKKSGLETEIDWLQHKESLVLTPSDLENDYLRKLLENGLIKLSYTKEY